MTRPAADVVMSTAGFAPSERAEFELAMDADVAELDDARLRLIARFYKAAVILGDEAAGEILTTIGVHASLLAIAGGP